MFHNEMVFLCLTHYGMMSDYNMQNSGAMSYRLILLLTYPDGHSDLASLMPKKQLSINIPVD